MEKKVQFSVALNSKTIEALDHARGNYSRNMVIEAMLLDYLGFPEEVGVTGYYRK